MSKANLQEIIDRHNFFLGFNKDNPKPEINIDTMTVEQANELYEEIDCGLSPENLHCDGEISRAQAQAKYRNYMGAVRELQKRGFGIPERCYEIG
jgi:hypothetical protein